MGVDGRYPELIEGVMRSLGHVVLSFGSLELQMARDLALMLGLPGDAAGPMIARRSFSWQLDEMKRIATKRDSDGPQLEAFLAAVVEARKLNTRRNDLYHSAYVIDHLSRPLRRVKWSRGTAPTWSGESVTAEAIWDFGDEIADFAERWAFEQTPFVNNWGPDPTLWPVASKGSTDG